MDSMGISKREKNVLPMTGGQPSLHRLWGPWQEIGADAGAICAPDLKEWLRYGV
jgi:hypothetical protein